jgi:hypothetical protein
MAADHCHRSAFGAAVVVYLELAEINKKLAVVRRGSDLP